MDFRYRWKNGAPPTRDQAATSSQLLDESQFTSQADRDIAEEAARKHLGVPLLSGDAEESILPQATPPEGKTS